ncbi:TIGR01777 family oxidoreductase [Aliikangiella sp. G2MR2-5]|uniref:TIGR01777 family oxidoreductase n=1 Tax=Aliikangiella sp. G2MR2-5 TaxID=2788943 RepID=UPI0018A91D25|nr:TIGR01777 family oxidoreductase [Aliikangiella sp. G2MR2-5]
MASYLVTGGTGLIGRALIEKLLASSSRITVLTRNGSKISPTWAGSVRYIERLNQFPEEEACEYVVNLAGAPIADKPWSASRKLELWQSRIDLTNSLVRWISERKHRPKTLISGSAVGWYGDGEDRELDEDSKPQPEYTHHLCDAWERSALKAVGMGVRVCISRTGLVLSPDGGFLKKLKLPFKLGLGASIASGKQYMSWIHIDDMVNALIFLLSENSNLQPEGIFNLTAPNPVTNLEFSHSLAQTLGRPCLFRAPERLLTVTLGEMSRLLTKGQRVIPQKLLNYGFEFHYPELNSALKDVLG